MKTTFALYVRVFPVTIEDQRTGQIQEDIVVLEKQQLQACQLVGQSSKELIQRIYNRAGFHVLDIGKPEKREIQLKLDELYRMHNTVKELRKLERI